MDNKDKINNREDEILSVIGKIARLASGGGYVYRGQSDAIYPDVSSTLYRAMKKRYSGSDDEWRNMNLDMNLAQKEVLKNARRFATEDYNDEKMLSHIQHYSGDTNLIDFTKDCYVALFFACERKGNEDGKIFLLKPSMVKGSEVEMVTFAHPLNRAVGQKSIFVQSRTGFIPNGMMSSVDIPCDLKRYILDYLRVYHGISEYSIYNDLHGYIRNRETQGNAVIEFYLGVSYSNKGGNAQLPKERSDAFKKAIEHFDSAIQFVPNLAVAYFNRGVVKQKLDDYEGAISDYDKAILLDPNDVAAVAYNNRGRVKERLGDNEGAISDYNKSIALNPNDAIACYNRGNFKRTCGNAKLKSGDMAGAVSDYKDAISDYDKADVLVPNDEDVHYNRGLAKEMLGNRQNLQQALFDMENAEKLALALPEDKKDIAELAQESIKRIKVKISKL